MMEKDTEGIGMVLLVAEDSLVIPALEVHIRGSDAKALRCWRLNNYDNLFNDVCN